MSRDNGERRGGTPPDCARVLRDARFPPTRARSALPVVLGVLAAFVAAGLARSDLLKSLNIHPNDAKDVFDALLAGVVVFTGYQQWREARREASLEKYYERLNLANELRARLHANPFVMYVFAELDNLEYVIEKYKLGYATPPLACRALSAFTSRCRDQTLRADTDSGRCFAAEALHWVQNQDAGYMPATRRVVERIHDDVGGSLRGRAVPAARTGSRTAAPDAPHR